MLTKTRPKDVPSEVEIIEEDIDLNPIHTGGCEDLSDLGLYTPDNEGVIWL